MQRFLPVLLLLALAIPQLPAHAQPSEGLRVGVRGGLNFSTFRGDTDLLFTALGSPDVGYRTSFHAGLVGAYSFDARYALQTELLYVQKGASFRGDFFGQNNVEGTYRFSYLQVPILFRVSFPLDGPATPYLFAGPSLEVNTISGIEGTFQGDTIVRKITEGTNTAALGGLVGGGVSYPWSRGRRLVVDFRYNPGVSDITTDDARIRTDTLLISVGFLFAL